VRASCEGCPKRDHCTSICADIARLLPAADAGTWARLNAIDRSVVWRVQDSEHRLTRRQKLVARLYYRFGFTMSDIACVLRVSERGVSRILERIRRKLENSSRKGVQKIP